MKVAIATKNFASVSGHAGQARKWLIYDLSGQNPGAPLPAPACVELAREQVIHRFNEDGPHPLDGVDLVVAGSAGDGFIARMKKRGGEVRLTGELDPVAVIHRILAGEPLPEKRFDITTSFCKLHDLFSRH